MTDILRSPLTIQAFAEANRTLSSGRFPDVEVQPSDHQAVVFPSCQVGKTEAARWAAEETPWTRAIMAALQAPGTPRLRTKRPGPVPGEGYANWYRRIFGEPFSDEIYSFVKPANVGTTEMAMASTLRSIRSFERYRDVDLWAARALDGSWLLHPRDETVTRWAEDWADGDLKAVWVGADYATDRIEWDVSGWGGDRWSVCNPPTPVQLKPAPGRTKRELLCTSANVDINKVKSIRSTKPANQVIRSLVVANRAPLPKSDWKRGHGPA